MICFPNAKINLGLNITEKRTDGFHNIETLMLPIPILDVLEFKESEEFLIEVLNSNSFFETKENTIHKIWKKLKHVYDIPAFRVKILKNIPTAAGLGGGSSDAAFFLKEINNIYNLKMSENEMESFIVDIGSDCPFFIRNKPALAEKKGEVLSVFDLNLKGRHLSLIKPNISISTKKAYSLTKPKIPHLSIKEIISEDISTWRNLLKNDFENVIEPLFPDLGIIKNSLYKIGADYVSLSGSGPTVYAISNNKLELSNFKKEEFVWQGIL